MPKFLFGFGLQGPDEAHADAAHALAATEFKAGGTFSPRGQPTRAPNTFGSVS